MRRGLGFGLLLACSLGLSFAFLVFPVAAIFFNTAPSRLISSLGDAAATDALKLSIETSAIAMAVIVIVGTPAAYWLATRRFPGKAVIVTLLELPLVLPPAVAGLGLLAALGPRGILGPALRSAHVQLVLQTAGVVVALCFVSAPIFLRQAEAAFAAVERPLIDASRTLGAGEAATFARVAVPVAAPALLTGLGLAWGRALGEFGATLMFAGSFQRVTQTAPLAIYAQFASDFPAALALSAVLIAVSGALLVSVKLLSGPASLALAAR
jgi:molybdate transport system permease protein